MAFPDRFIEEVRARADIVDVVSSYFPLTRSGSNYKALCPFHREKTPSFFVSPQKQIYHCFGCGKGGNVFSFIMEYEKVSFPEAVKILAQRYNVPIPEESNKKKDIGPSVRSLWAVNSWAAKFYHRLLFTKEGKSALNYLFSRGLSWETIKKFYLGYAPVGSRNFLKFALEKGVKEDLLLSSGLVVKSDRRDCYDRFRNRVIFPVFDLQSRVVGFGGRILDPEDQPKYLNSPDTPVFKKSKILYGMNLARKVAERGIVVVEGYMDLIALHQAGIENVVATLGTSLTEDHLHLLQRFTREVFFLFDGDSAGVKAAIRAVKLSLPMELSVRVVTLPEGIDPDEFIKTYGVQGFSDLISNAYDGAEFLFEQIISKYDLDDPKQKSLVLKELFDLLIGVENSIIQSAYFTLLSRRLKVSESAIIREFTRFKSKLNRRHEKQEEVFVEEIAQLRGPAIELLKIALCYPDFRDVIKEVLLPTDFDDGDLVLIWEAVQNGLDLESILLKIQSGEIEVKETITSWLNSLAFFEPVDVEELLVSAMKGLKDKRRRKRVELLRQAIRERESQGLDYSDLLSDLNEILRK